MGWKTLFSGKSKQGVKDQPEESEGNSEECLAVSDCLTDQIKEGPEMVESIDRSTPTSPCSPRTHNRSFSHDSYFNLFGESGSQRALKHPRENTLAEEGESDFNENSPVSNSKMFLEINELNLEFNTSEAEMKIFSEDDTLKSTSLGESMTSLTKSNVDCDDISLDYSSRRDGLHKNALRDRLKSKVTSKSPVVPKRKVSADNSSGREQELIRNRVSASVPSKDVVSDVTPLPKQSANVAQEDFDKKSQISEEELERSEISCTLIDADLMKKLTHLRSSSNTSSSSARSIGDNVTNASDNDTFTGKYSGLIIIFFRSVIISHFYLWCFIE